jgi:hypothetical protein
MIPVVIATKETASHLSKSSVKKKSHAGMRKASPSVSITQVQTQVEIVKHNSGQKAVLVTVKALVVCMMALYRFSR